ncbi:kelch-like protein 10 [Zootermopsis nevadensis]|uniref:kelch-like protein 10 n=1 Tax=Zootermopsis nevadensis TaxID=136037 RepID=UPI000B8ED45C|nr:kelch-like protein 10 [Zootermopsis nevadensis]
MGVHSPVDNHDPDNRKGHIAGLLKGVRLGLLDAKFFKEKVERVDSIGPRAIHGTAVVGFDIYVIGGFDGRTSLSSCFCFNAATKTCREVAPMNARRWGLMVAVLRGSVYVMGGYEHEHREDLRTAERYDCKTNHWFFISSMNRERYKGSAAVLNDKIYVAGGRDGKNYLNSVEVYDPDTDRWTFVTPMLSGRRHFSCVAFHGFLYAIGGRNETSEKLSTEKYDPAEDTWTEIPGMNYYSGYLNAEVIDDIIYVISGYYDNVVACFNDKENRWQQVADMNICRYGISTCVIKDLPKFSDQCHSLGQEVSGAQRQINGGETQKKEGGVT